MLQTGGAAPRPLGARARHGDGLALSRRRSASTRCSSSSGSRRSPTGARRSSRAAQTQRVRFAIALVTQPRAARARRADGGDGRRGAATRSGRRCAHFAARGKTVLFATHYLEEADAYADRAVADGARPRRRRRPDHRDQGDGRRRARSAPRCRAPTSARSARLPGRQRAERRGEAVVLRCADSDAAIRALLERVPAARDIEITGAGLEEAFLELTARRRPRGGGMMSSTTYIRYELLRCSATGGSSSSRSASRSSSTS